MNPRRLDEIERSLVGNIRYLVREAKRAEKIAQLEDVNTAAMAACTAYLFRDKEPERFEKAMKHLYTVSRDDLWKEWRARA